MQDIRGADFTIVPYSKDFKRIWGKGLKAAIATADEEEDKIEAEAEKDANESDSSSDDEASKKSSRAESNCSDEVFLS